MDDRSAAIFRAKYNSLKTTFEGRLASLADTVRRAVESVQQDQVLQQLNANVNTTEFAPAHAHVLIKRHLASERDAFFHDLALRLADAEAEVSQCNRRNEELGSSLSVLQSDASREEQSRVQATVNADIQELRREYQIALEDAGAQCRQLKAQLSHAKRRLGVLKGERDQLAVQSRSLEQALANVEAKELDVLRYHYELREEKSANAALSSDLMSARQSSDDLASSHEKLKIENDSLQTDLNQRSRRLQLADVNRKKNEVRFREAITRMESLMEEEAKDSVSAIKNLRDKAMLAKDRLSTEVDRLRGANKQLTKNLASTKAKCLELDLQLQAALKSKEMEASAAAVREGVLRTDAEQARSRADTMSQSLAEAIREQSGLVTETANAKVAAGVLEAQSRTVEVEMARAAGREDERAQACAHGCTLSTVLAPGPDWEVGNLLTEKLQEASTHISELRTVLRQEVRRREGAEAEVSEARGYLSSSRQELQELRHLAWKLEQMGRNSIAHIDEKNRAIKHLEDELHVRGVAGADERVEDIIELGQGDGARIRGERTRAGVRVDGYTTQESSTALGMVVKTRRGSGKDEEAEWCTRRHVLPQNLSSGKRMVASLSGLRSELQSLTTQLCEIKAENDEFVRQCAEGVAVRVERLVRGLQQARRKQVEAQIQAFEAKVDGANDKKHADTMTRVIQGITAILLDSLSVAMPTCLGGGVAVGEEPEGVLEKGLSELATAIAYAANKAKRNAEESFFTQASPDSSSKVADGTDSTHRRSTMDGMVWGERSKDDFNMLAQLQKIEVESELQSLKAQLDDMTEKYSRAIAEQETVDSAPLREERERAKEELARAARAHSGTVSALKATLAAEKSHCQDIRMRLERQTREHQAALAEADQKLLQTQEELDKVQQVLEQAQFALDRETARRVRLDKKYSELEDRGLVSPRSLSPRVWRPDTASRKIHEESERSQTSLPRPSSARIVLEEAREKLGQASDASTATRGRPEVRAGQPHGRVLDSRSSTLEGAPPDKGRDGESHSAHQGASASVSP
ncbi:unnamed protein product, partial [Pylaiella littoralis]